MSKELENAVKELNKFRNLNYQDNPLAKYLDLLLPDYMEKSNFYNQINNISLTENKEIAIIEDLEILKEKATTYDDEYSNSKKGRSYEILNSETDKLYDKIKSHIQLQERIIEAKDILLGFNKLNYDFMQQKLSKLKERISYYISYYNRVIKMANDLYFPEKLRGLNEALSVLNNLIYGIPLDKINIEELRAKASTIIKHTKQTLKKVKVLKEKIREYLNSNPRFAETNQEDEQLITLENEILSLLEDAQNE